MKQKLLFALLLMVLSTVSMSAYTFEVGGIYYNKINDTDVEVTRPDNNHHYEDSIYDGDIVIPATVTYEGVDYTVTRIGFMAFYFNYNVKNVTLPNTITEIRSKAFADSRCLMSINIPNSVTTIGSNAFAHCYRLMNIVIPNSVESIGYQAFFGSGLACDLFIPASVTYIGAEAFVRCGEYTSIAVDSENPKYDSRDNCNAIIETATNNLMVGCSKTVIPNTVATIGTYAFWGLRFTSIDIPNSVSEIGDDAFGYCYYLEDINLGNSVTYIGKHAFQFSGVKNLVIPNSVTTLSDGSFQDCDSLTDLIIGENVGYIGEEAFYGASNLETVTSLATTPPFAFYYSTDIYSSSDAEYPIVLRVPGQSIEDYKATYGWDRCKWIIPIEEEFERTSPPIIHCLIDDISITQTGCSITIENTDADANAEIFYLINHEYDSQVSSLWTQFLPGDTIYIPYVKEGNNSYDVRAYAIADGKIMSHHVKVKFSVPEPWYLPDYNTYHDFCVDGIYYTILGDSTVAVSKEMCDHYFSCGILGPGSYEGDPCVSYSGDVNIPATVQYDGKIYTVTAIADQAFALCELTSITLPNTITEIGAIAFFHSTLPAIVIPASVTRIGNGAFFDCWEISSIDIPASVNEICEGAFAWCFGLNKVVNHRTTPLEIVPYVFNGVLDSETATLYVPNNSVETYRVHEVWGKFPRIVPFLGTGPGDINGDGSITISDVTTLIDQLISGEDLPACYDVNGDGTIAIGDVTTLIDQLLSAY